MDFDLPRDPAVWSAVFAGFALLVTGWMAWLTMGMVKATKQAASAADRSADVGQVALEAARESALAAKASASIAQAGLAVRFVIQAVESPPPFCDEEEEVPHLAISCPTATVFVHRIEVQWMATATKRISAKLRVMMMGNGQPTRLHPNEAAAGPIQMPQTQAVLEMLGKPGVIAKGEATVWYSFDAASEPIPVQAPIIDRPSTWVETRPHPRDTSGLDH